MSVHEIAYQAEESYFWYRARLDILLSLSERFLKKDTPLIILNVGGGTGATSKGFSRFGEVITLDIAHEALLLSRKRGLSKLIQGDGALLPFPSGSFDLVLLLDVIEHLDDDLAALTETKRVLKDEGIALITVPAYRFLWGKMDDIGGHRRRYIKRKLEKRLEATGLTPLKLSYFNTLLFPLALIDRISEGLRKKGEEEESFLPELPPFLNKVFYHIFSFERHLLPHLNLPFGLSILALAQKG
ncbi:MAG: class I SAM-dependent methyltransferase [Acidobacteria bacterium]|nr:class I SAM-dependent methyltransferase [Acidobacteriota bacterium]